MVVDKTVAIRAVVVLAGDLDYWCIRQLTWAYVRKVKLAIFDYLISCLMPSMRHIPALIEVSGRESRTYKKRQYPKPLPHDDRHSGEKNSRCDDNVLQAMCFAMFVLELVVP